MLTPQQAFELFTYADWVMMFVGATMFVAAVGWGLSALLPRFRGRRLRILLRALICFGLFGLFWATQASVMIPFVNQEWTPLMIALFALPAVVMFCGIFTSLTYGVAGVRRRSGHERRNAALRAMLGVIVFGAGIAPHTVAALMPLISYESHANSAGTLVHTGQLVPDFDLKTVGGTVFQPHALRGNVTVLNFFATWCGPCQLELPHLQAIWDEFRSDSHFRLIVVGREETDEGVKAFQQKNGFTFPMAADPQRTVYGKFAEKSIPRTYLISSDGKIVFETTGYYENDIARLKKLIRRELARTK